MRPDFLQQLRRRKLLSREPEPHEAAHLLALCDAGCLSGGLSLAMDVRPDEALGPLTHRMGGSALNLKVLEVRDGPPLELTVQDRSGVEHRWEVSDVQQLVEVLNDTFGEQPGTAITRVLGESNDMLQLWTLDPEHLRALIGAPELGLR